MVLRKPSKVGELVEGNSLFTVVKNILRDLADNVGMVTIYTFVHDVSV